MDSIIKLNIGGQRFETTRTTLLREKASLLAGCASDVKEEVFFDRDPTHFRSILNWLRTGQLPQVSDDRERTELLLEVNFYKLNLLRDALHAAVSAAATFDESAARRLSSANVIVHNGAGQNAPIALQCTRCSTVLLSDQQKNKTQCLSCRRVFCHDCMYQMMVCLNCMSEAAGSNIAPHKMASGATTPERKESHTSAGTGSAGERAQGSGSGSSGFTTPVSGSSSPLRSSGRGTGLAQPPAGTFARASSTGTVDEQVSFRRRSSSITASDVEPFLPTQLIQRRASVCGDHNLEAMTHVHPPVGGRGRVLRPRSVSGRGLGSSRSSSNASPASSGRGSPKISPSVSPRTLNQKVLRNSQVDVMALPQQQQQQKQNTVDN